MPTNNKIAVLAANRWTIISLVLGFLVSFSTCLGVVRYNVIQAEESVSAAAEAAADAVVNRLKLYQYGLRGARGSIQTMAEEDITRRSFDRYSLTRDVDEEFPGARGFGFVRRVPLQDETDFLAQARADGWPDFAIRQLTPHEGERYVIQYINPLERNSAAIGLDIASEANRRQAAISSMRTGEVRLTGPITLVQTSGLSQQSFLILMPIYSGGVTPKSPEARESQTLGWSYAALSMGGVLEGLLPAEQEVSLELNDVSDAAHSIRFYSYDDQPSQDIVYSHTTERDVYGRRWQLQFGVHPSFINQLNQLSPLVVLSVGLLLSVLLAALVGLLNISRLRQLQVITEQAKLAAIVESSADGILGMDLDGTVSSWNRGAQELFGFSAREAIGRRINELIIPAERQAEESEILARIKSGGSISAFDTQRRHNSGRLIPVSVTVSPICNSEGLVIGASKTVRDISEKMTADARIQELNSSLEAQVVERTSELRQTNLLLGSVLRAASEVAIIATDSQGLIRLFNIGAERMLGYQAPELIGKSSPAGFHLAEEVIARSLELTTHYGETIEGFRVFVHRAEVDGAETRDWTYVRKDGSHLPVSLAVTAMRDEHGEINGFLGVAVDLTAQKTAANAVASARDQLLMAADIADLGIWSWTLEDNSLSWNDRMFELYGQPQSLREAGLSYEHWHSRIHPDDVEMATQKLQSTVETGEPYDPTFRVVRPDGEVRIVQAGAQVEHDGRGEVVGLTGFNRDITAQRELQARLLEAKVQADAASADKSSFMANMSHEIRTPMNAVLGMLHLVQNTELNARQFDYVSKAESAAKSLLGLLNDILDYSKIDAGKLQLDIHAFELESLMRDLAIVLSGNQGNKDVEVMFDLDPQLPAALMGDSFRLQQILTNLAGNALKFTQQGQVVVRVEQLRRQGDQAHLRIEVSDTGIGIKPDQLERIFDGFTQAEASTTRRFGGTGLGLVISKRLIKLMDGVLQVSSEYGVGSRFWFEIELSVSTQLPLQSLSSKADRPLHLLVADDNEVAGFLLVRMIESMGWQVDLVYDGVQAIERVQQMRSSGKSYDAILMDWRMPGMDGLSAARLIRQQSDGQPVPTVIMITAHGREILSDAQQTGDAPFADFLSKPVTPRQLASAIHRIFMVKDDSQPSAASLRAAQPKRLAGLSLLVVEDNMLNRQVAFELLQGEGADVMLAEVGVEGVRLVTESAEPFDAVLMDIQMPDIDGLEATRRIRANTRRGAVKIIAMTANASHADAQVCLAVGMDDHLGKPIDLEKMVATLLRLTGGAGCGVEPAHALQPEQNDSVVEPIASISQRFGHNHELIRNVMSGFASDQEKQLVRLQEQVVRRNAAGAAEVLHAIKGSSATMGARSMAQLAGELEQQFLHGDEDAITQLFIGGSCVETLRGLLLESDELLRTAFELPAQDISSVNENVHCLADPQWREALHDILQLLEAGNMQAIEQSEALQVLTPKEFRPQFETFVELVKTLDFSASLLAGHQLLNSV
jgi:PAS domain S-box-containing protein